jgi:hypothetical protein
MTDKIINVDYGNGIKKMVLEPDGVIRPLKDGEDGNAVETIRLFDPE